MSEPAVVVGGTVGALTAADALARAGREVRLVLPEHGVGGGFLPMRRDGRRLELGVRVLELGYEDDLRGGDVPPLSAYVPGFGGHRPYTPLVRAWVEELAGDRLVDAPAPRMIVEGAEHDDVYFTVDLTGLRDVLGPARTAVVAREAGAALATHGEVGVLGRINGHTLDEASRANHGDTLHELLIAPVAEKFLAGGAQRTLAAWRRKVWMPLFWPRTVAEACHGSPSFAPARRFETVGDEGPGAVVEALLARLRGSARVDVVTGGPLRRLRRLPTGATELTIDGLEPWSVRRAVVGVGARELFAASGHEYAPERARSVIAWVETHREAPVPITHVVAADNPVARVSDSGPGAAPRSRVLCVELRHDIAKEEIGERALDGLRAAGILAPGASADVLLSGAMETYDAPTAATRDAHAAAVAHLEAQRLDVLVVGGAIAPGADSFNEQVVAGLAAAEALA